MRPPRIILILYGTDAVFGLLAGASYAVTTALDISRIEILRLGAESNLPTWYSSSQLLLIALVLAPLAWRDIQVRKPATWVAAMPAALFALLSLDETAMVHERVGWAFERLGTVDASQFDPTWMLFMVPIYALIAVPTYRLSKRYLRNRPDVIRLVWAGALLFAVSAVGVEALAALSHPENTSLRRILGVVEEVGEMAAGTTFLWAALRLAAHENIRIQTRAESAT